MRKLVRNMLGAAALAACFGTLAVAATADVPGVDDIMSEAHNKKKGVEPKIKVAVSDGKWDDAAKPAERLKELGEALGKNKNEKGSAESWKKLTEQYKKTTADIADAVKKKDKKAAEAALGKLGRSCDSCHEVHRD